MSTKRKALVRDIKSETKKEDKDKDIPSSQRTIDDIYKKPRTRSESKKEEDKKKEDCIDICLTDTEQLCNIREQLGILRGDIQAINKDIVDMKDGLGRLLDLALVEEDNISLKDE